MKRSLVTGAAVIALAGTTPAAAEPYGPGPGMCSFQGQNLAQYYPCAQPPAWLFQPEVSSADAVPGVGTANSPYRDSS